MGIFGKLASMASQIVTSKGTSEKITTSVGNAISNKLVAKGEEDLKQLEIVYEREKQEHLRKKDKLENKIQKGDKRAIKKLKKIENEFKIQTIEYEGNKNVILAKQPKLEERLKSRPNEAKNVHCQEIVASNRMENMLYIKCKNCGQESSKGVKYCSNCGTEITDKIFCASCGAELNTNANFCPNCGQKK